MGDISYIKNKNLGQKKILEPKIEKKNKTNETPTKKTYTKPELKLLKYLSGPKNFVFK